MTPGETIYNLHRRTTENIGDLRSAPLRYFPFLSQAKSLDLVEWEKANRETPIEEDPLRHTAGVIVGGGGLLEIDFFTPAIDRLRRLNAAGAKVAFWGVGHNEWRIGDWRKLKHTIKPLDFEDALIGIRDFGQAYRWTPCVSCMSRHFDRTFEIEHEVVAYLHSATLERWPHTVSHLTSFPTLSNKASFEEAIAFLGSGALILTDSYHGAYWGTLLGRKVVAFPSSSKLYDMRHAVPLCSPADWKRYARLAVAYPEALEDCRAATQAFADDVKAFFKT